MGALLLAAHYHSRWFLLFTGTLSHGTSAEAFPGLLLQFPGRSKKDSWHNCLKSDHGVMRCYYGTLFLLLATLGFRMVCRCILNFKVTVRKGSICYEDKMVSLQIDRTGLPWPDLMGTEPFRIYLICLQQRLGTISLH